MPNNNDEPVLDLSGSVEPLINEEAAAMLAFFKSQKEVVEKKEDGEEDNTRD